MDIDVVVLWVDDNDPEWQTQRNRYRGLGDETSIIRYRDWGILKYWFRSVEKNIPWVRKIFFVTCGHYPDWLNRDNPKLRLVKHEDYIPHEFLPTFSAMPIELNLHRIEELSEHFIYFNDDMFVVNKLSPDFFFRKGLPRASAVMSARSAYVIENDRPVFVMPLVDINVLNRHFKKHKAIARHWYKWFAPCYGRHLIDNIYLIPAKEFTGFKSVHLPNSYLKSTFEEIWQAEESILYETSKHRFRMINDVNQFLMMYWQFASGKFIPRTHDVGRKITINRANKGKIHEVLNDPGTKMICLNDDEELGDDFDDLKDFIIRELDSLFPEKSSFEL